MPPRALSWPHTSTRFKKNVSSEMTCARGKACQRAESQLRLGSRLCRHAPAMPSGSAQRGVAWRGVA
jgi:hypothetical protein